MENKKPVIGVLGSGSWATALIKILTSKDNKVNWWVRREDDVKHILSYKHNPAYLSAVEIHLNRVTPVSNIEDVIKNSDWLILVVPAAFVKDALKGVDPELFKGKKVISAIKGMIPDENLLISDFMEEYYGTPSTDTAVIAGPCHAEEVAMEKQSYLTIASENIEFAQALCEVLDCHFIKVHAIQDLYGVEYSAVIKNIIAIACGIAHGLNYGDNFQAVLVSNALQEIERFVEKINAMERQLSASAYLGDLLVTTYSQFSRNRTFGNMIGRGYSVKTAQLEMEMIAEGYYAVKCIYEINKKLELDLPIINSVYNVLYDKISPFLEFRILQNHLK
ncbi:MAG: glycerol-3-phosphate dehydrogenase [Thalassobius sp.]|nr:glycerol-3-phosphate dehydrogenase [Thalassovita sp.]